MFKRLTYILLIMLSNLVWAQDTCKVVIDYDPADCIFQYTYDRDLYLFACDSTTIVDQAHYDYDISGNVVNSTTLNGWIDWSGIIGDTLNILNPNIDSCYYLCDKVRDWCNFGIADSEWSCTRFELIKDPIPCLNPISTDTTYHFGSCDPSPPLNCEESTYLYQEYILSIIDTSGNVVETDTLIQYPDCSTEGGFFTSAGADGTDGGVDGAADGGTDGKGGGRDSLSSADETGSGFFGTGNEILSVARTTESCDSIPIPLDSLSVYNDYLLCSYVYYLCDGDTLEGRPVCDTIPPDCSNYIILPSNVVQVVGDGVPGFQYHQPDPYYAFNLTTLQFEPGATVPNSVYGSLVFPSCSAYDTSISGFSEGEVLPFFTYPYACGAYSISGGNLLNGCEVFLYTEGSYDDYNGEDNYTQLHNYYVPILGLLAGFDIQLSALGLRDRNFNGSDVCFDLDLAVFLHNDVMAYRTFTITINGVTKNFTLNGMGNNYFFLCGETIADDGTSFGPINPPGIIRVQATAVSAGGLIDTYDSGFINF